MNILESGWLARSSHRPSSRNGSDGTACKACARGRPNAHSLRYVEAVRTSVTKQAVTDQSLQQTVGEKSGLASRGHSFCHGAAAALVFVCIIVTGCDRQPTEVEDYTPEPVLTAFLTNGEPVNEILLQWVAPLNEYYDPREYGIRDATVSLFPVGAADTLFLIEDPDDPGRYIPPPGIQWVPASKTRYRIEALFDGDRFVWAETVIPDTFSVSVMPPDAIGDTLTRVDPNIALQWTGADGAGGYVLNIISLRSEDSLSSPSCCSNLVLMAADDDSLVQSAVWLMREDQRAFTMPWILFRWTGLYRVDLLAATPEYYEYVYAWLRALQGEQFDMPSNVQGGLGIFAGLSRYSFEFYWRRT